MANPFHHAVSSVKKYGGVWQDYHPLHAWFDQTKALVADPRHRMVLHNTWGIFLLESVFGPTISIPSTGKLLPTRWIGEQHVQEDFGGRIPTLAQCFAGMDSVPPWMQFCPAPTAYEQARASAAQFGGQWEDYHPLHAFFDEPQDLLPDDRYRVLLHNGFGMRLALQRFGIAYLRPSDQVQVDTQRVVLTHLQRDWGGTVPSLNDCLATLPLERWMGRDSLRLSKLLATEIAAITGDPAMEPEDCNATTNDAR